MDTKPNPINRRTPDTSTFHIKSSGYYYITKCCSLTNHYYTYIYSFTDDDSFQALTIYDWELHRT